jgi:hypothetical protein
MKKIILFLIALVWIPSSFAQVLYQQKEFIFSVPPFAPPIIVTREKLVAECEAGIAFVAGRYNIHGINPSNAGKWKISAIRTSDINGKFLEDAVNEIGEILICQDRQTYPPEKNIWPVYYEILVNGRRFRAVGGGTSPDFPELEILPGGIQLMTPLGYPNDGVFQLNSSATVLASTPGKVGGAFSLGRLEVDEDQKEFFDGTGIGVLRLTVPIQGSED